MVEVQVMLMGFLFFMVYFVLGLVIMVVFMWIYMFLMFYDEIVLVKVNNVVVVIVWIGVIFGFGIVLFGVLCESESFLEFLIWGVIVGIVQLFVFYVY